MSVTVPRLYIIVYARVRAYLENGTANRLCETPEFSRGGAVKIDSAKNLQTLKTSAHW